MNSDDQLFMNEIGELHRAARMNTALITCCALIIVLAVAFPAGVMFWGLAVLVLGLVFMPKSGGRDIAEKSDMTELKKTFAGRSCEELRKILSSPGEYRTAAVEAARCLLAERDMTDHKGEPHVGDDGSTRATT